MLAVMAFLMACAGGGTLAERFGVARDNLVAMYDSRLRPGRSYQGFISALAKRSAHLLKVIVPAFRKAVQRIAGSHWRTGPWVVLGVDGSRVECPMTESNEEAFGCAGKKKTTPQQLITIAFHVGLHLLWSWKRGDSCASERHQLRNMIEHFPDKSMILADAGFTGYEVFRALQAAGHDFVIRVGSGIRLLKKLGYRINETDQSVYLWPQEMKRSCPTSWPVTCIASVGAWRFTSTR